MIYLLILKISPSLQDQLIFADQFNQPGMPDPASWGYEVGFIRNHQKQYYTKARPQNVRIENGSLVIESRKQAYSGANYTSGSINTEGKLAFSGDIRVQARAILPQGKGIWPAFWMMGINIQSVGWPKCSQIDIMQFLGRTPGVIYSTFHWADSTIANWGHASYGKTINVPDLHTQFHVYSFERVGQNLKLFVDHKLVVQMNIPSTSYQCSFNCPVFILINTAVGGDWSGQIDDSIFPQRYTVDYVRVYKIESTIQS